MGYSLGRCEREALTNHFLADGHHEMAFVMMFLPLYLDNCKTNECVGLHQALVLLVELLSILRADGSIQAQTHGSGTISVDLTELADFSRKVMHPHTFVAVAGHIRLTSNAGLPVQVLITTEYWQRVSHRTCSAAADDKNSVKETAAQLRKFERRLDGIS